MPGVTRQARASLEQACSCRTREMHSSCALLYVMPNACLAAPEVANSSSHATVLGSSVPGIGRVPYLGAAGQVRCRRRQGREAMAERTLHQARQGGHRTRTSKHWLDVGKGGVSV